jgi:hypothetical protein
MDRDCRRAKVAIDHSFNTGAPIDEKARRHLAVCAECRELLDAWGPIVRELRSGIDESLESLAPPRIPELPKKKRQQRRSSLPWIAAVALFFFVSLFVYRWARLQPSLQFIREENRLFVENLFGRNLFEGTELEGRLSLSNVDWFRGTEDSGGLTSDISPYR